MMSTTIQKIFIVSVKVNVIYLQPYFILCTHRGDTVSRLQLSAANTGACVYAYVCVCACMLVCVHVHVCVRVC